MCVDYAGVLFRTFLRYLMSDDLIWLTAAERGMTGRPEALMEAQMTKTALIKQIPSGINTFVL